MKLPLGKFCDLTLAAVLEGRDETQQARVMYELDKPLPGRELEVPTEDQAQRELAEMMALSAGLGQ